MIEEPHLAWFSRGAELRELANRAASLGMPSLPLYEAAAAGRLNFCVMLNPLARWPAAMLQAAVRPVVLLIGDDPWPRAESVGPHHWKCTKRLQRWARFAVIHGTGSSPEPYRAAITSATLTGAVALIETSSRHAVSWAGCFGRSRTLLAVPPEGEVHPAAPKREAMH